LPHLEAQTEIIPETVKTGRSFTFKNVTGFILIIAMAGVFFYSGWSKMHNNNAFDNFQWTFFDLGINSTMTAGIMARLMIGLEFALGLFLLGHIYLRKFTYPAVITILAIFIFYLLLVIYRQGNTGDCGCFGDQLAMKPLPAIIKNLVMIAVTGLLMVIYPVAPYKNQEFASPVLAMIALTVPFLLNPVDTGTAPVAYKRNMELDLLYKYSPAPAIDLRKGKHIIAFMSLSCHHCKKAAYLLQIIHREHPEFPIYLVIDGAEPFKKAFFDETHAENVPHLFYFHTDEFVHMAGNDGVPAIYWVKNGVAEYKSQYTYYQLDPAYMQQWLKQP
jgi:uncharacterized membrane protein YphA (DoxX/SURF4 family)